MVKKQMVMISSLLWNNNKSKRTLTRLGASDFKNNWTTLHSKRQTDPYLPLANIFSGLDVDDHGQ